jgi:single-stranded-DNA-specific exonuclease
MNYQLIAPRLPELSVVEQVFENRGIKKQDIYHYLHTSKNDLYDPLLLDRIQDGVKMLVKHINNQDKTLIQVDSDCDGYTSSAFLINYLNQWFPAYVQNCVTYRVHDNKSHGLILETIPEDTKLVIAPDSSSNDYEVHKALHYRGCDVLVLDHHLADHVSEYACIINNQMCGYPNKSLSGVGIVYKFCSYLDTFLGQNKADEFLDLAAVGIIADIMDLRDFETRWIIEYGMSHIRNPFIKEMMKRMDFKINGKLNPFKVSFYIAPFVNAMNRSGTLDERLLLFESMLEYRAYELIPSTKRGAKGTMETRVEQASRTCSNVKNRQAKSRDLNTEMIEEIITENKLYHHTLIAVKLSKEQAADRNLTGLIATQIANKYGHPTAILNETEHDGEKWWEGSMRGAPHIEITDTRQVLLDTGLVQYCEGHANAAGIGIKDSDFKKLIEYLDTIYDPEAFKPVWNVDVEIPLDQAEDGVGALGRLADYWGFGIEEPHVVITKVKITKENCQMMKSNTFKISFGDLSFIKFKMPDEEFEALVPEMGYKMLTIVGLCHINNWNDYEYPQVEIEDYSIDKVMKWDF